MVLPIYVLGYPLLKKIASPIEKGGPELDELITNMWDTMYNAKGVGLAAPQIGKSIRIFIIDTIQMMDEKDEDKGLKKVIINPIKIEEDGDSWDYEEGCLSIPNIRGDVNRPERIKLKYCDQNFVEHVDIFDGLNARVIQHEYDHLEGELFIDKLKPIRKRRIQKKLNNMKKGIVDCDYKIKTFVAK